jgi:hypothetical protein
MIANLTDEDLCLVHGGATYIRATYTSPNTSVVVADHFKELSEAEAMHAALLAANSEGS